MGEGRHEPEVDCLDRYHVRIRNPKDMPMGLQNVLRHAHAESKAACRSGETDMHSAMPPVEYAPAGIDKGLVRSLLGLLCLLLGIVGVVAQILLLERHVLPPMSWLWWVSTALGTLGLASVGCDFVRAFRERPGDTE